MQNDAATLENSLAIPQIIKNLPYVPIILFLDIYPRETNLYYSSIIHNNQKAKMTQMSIKQWLDKQNAVCPI